MAKTKAELKQDERNRKKNGGLVHYEVWTYPELKPSVKNYVEKLNKRREDAEK